MPLSDELRAAFVADFQRGEHAACLRLLFENLGDELRRMFDLCTANQAEAAELTARLRERAARELPSLARPDLAEAWFWTCARDITRERALQARAATRRGRPELAASPPPAAPAAAQAAPLLEILARATPVDAAIIAFRIAGWTDQRIAAELGLDAASVARRYQGAMAHRRPDPDATGRKMRQ